MVYIHNKWGKSNNTCVLKANLEKNNKMLSYYLWINVFGKVWILQNLDITEDGIQLQISLNYNYRYSIFSNETRMKG